MLSVLVSWLAIFVVSLLFGYGAIRLLYKGYHETLWKPDIYLFCGLMLIDVYAQIFSLFYKLGAMACGLLFIIGFICLVGYTVKFIRRGGIDISA